MNNLQHNILIAPYTTYGIGGPADLFFVAHTKSELVQAVVYARENSLPYFVLGTGANIVCGDNGFRGLVIKNETKDILISENVVVAESGVTIAELITSTCQLGLSGFEHFAGIPSTVGGAVWQNLHFLSPNRSHTVFIDSIITSAEIVDEQNNVYTVEKDFFKFGYDTSILHHRNIVVTQVTFVLEVKDKESIQKQIDENVRWRTEKHPPLQKFPSCGSVFKQIDGVGSGRLIDQVGLKGYRVGGAQVSERHANFIVNTGGATAADVRTLITFIQEKVRAKTGYSLEPEIGFIGE